MTWRVAVVWVLAAAVVLTAFGVVISRQEARQAYKELVRLQQARDELEVEWGRLQLELGTQGTLARVESKARKTLGMRMPAIGDAVMVLP
jgi:cell division protein FtsL